MKLRFLRPTLFSVCCLFVCSSVGYPDVGALTSLTTLRSDEEHPLDLYKAHRLTNALPEENPRFDIVVNVTEVDGKGDDWVTVTWSGVRRPNERDIVALYAVGDDWDEKAPIKSLYAAESETHLTHGQGQFEVRMLNHRVDVKFVFIREFFGFPRYTGESEVIRIRNRDYPLYVHLAMTEKPNEMLVQWVSATEHTPVVKWGGVSGKYDEESTGESTTYTADDLCGRPATTQGYLFPGYFHSAIITDLVPGKKYYYVFGNERSGFSDEYSFVAPPEVGSDKTIKIIGIADMGQYNIDYFDNAHGREASLITTKHIRAEEDVDLLVEVGDISYAQGYVADWDVFFDQLLPLTSKVPFMTVPGNHDRLYPGSGDRYDTSRNSGGECGVAYEKRLQMPAKETDKPWYSFNFGPIHFLTFSTEHDFEQGTEQYQFIQKDLESIDRQLTPWVIAWFHRPMFPGITRDRHPGGYWYVGQELQATFDDLFYKNKVDMLWSGHHHSYQRTCPVHNEECVPLDPVTGEARAPVQLIIANSGAHLYRNLVKRDFIEFQIAEYGYSRFEVNRTHLTCEAILNEDRSVMDTVTLYKSPTT